MQVRFHQPRHDDAGTPSLEVRGLVKNLGNQRVVDGVAFCIDLNESVVLLGPSGCGKTTTLRMVAGFLQPDAGEILLDGRLVSSSTTMTPIEKRNLGMVFQSYAIWPHKTVFENVAYGPRLAKMSRKEVDARVSDVLDIVKLEPLRNRYPNELSGGQQQRVALARAIAVEPSLLLLDEPLSNLDAGLRQEMRHELLKLNKRIGMTSLYVTHDQDEALTLADRIAVMNKGRIEQIDTPTNIYFRPANHFVASFVGVNNLIPCTLAMADKQSGMVKVNADIGAALRASASAETLAQVAEGDRAVIAVRPEDFSLVPADSPAGEEMIPNAVIKQIAFMGSRFEMELEVGGLTLNVNLHRCPYQEGDKCHLLVNPDAAWMVGYDR